MINSNTQPLINGVRSGAQTGYKAILAIGATIGIVMAVIAYPFIWCAVRAYEMATGRKVE
jgi:hypothetical protein